MVKKLLLIDPAQYAKLDLAGVLRLPQASLVYLLDLAGVLRLPQASLAYLAALTPPDWDIKIIDENIGPLTFEDADLVGITAYTCNATRAYEISEQYRRKGIKTVIGGVHASMMCDEAMQFADSVVIGEAESVWRDLLRDFESNELKPFYRGQRVSLENLVKPRRDLYSKRYRLISVETSRGCPNDCEFCSVPNFNGRTYRQRPVQEVLDELETLDRKFFFFSDDNILGYGKAAEERAIQLFQGMRDRGLNKQWGCYVGIDFANNPEVLKYAKKAGCLGVFIGFESVSKEALQDMHKVRNLKVGIENYKEVVKKIHDHGIGIFGSFVLGCDRDKRDVFERTTEFILDSKIDVIQLSVLTPLPGTRLYARLKQEGRLLRTNYPDDWKHYNFTHVVFKPMHMTPDDLGEGVAQVYRDTASRLTSLKRAFNSAVETKNSFGAALAYLGNRGVRALWLSKHKEERTVAGHDDTPQHSFAAARPGGETGGRHLNSSHFGDRLNDGETQHLIDSEIKRAP